MILGHDSLSFLTQLLIQDPYKMMAIMEKLVAILGSIFLISIASVYSEDEGLDVASATALKQTQDLLKDKAARDKAIKGDSHAVEADANAGRVAGTAENKEATYGLSSEIMAYLVKKTAGDPIALQKIMNDAQRNPEAFAESLPPEYQSKLRGLAGKIEADKKLPPSTKPH